MKGKERRRHRRFQPCLAERCLWRAVEQLDELNCEGCLYTVIVIHSVDRLPGTRLSQTRNADPWERNGCGQQGPLNSESKKPQPKSKPRPKPHGGPARPRVRR